MYARLAFIDVMITFFLPANFYDNFGPNNSLGVTSTSLPHHISYTWLHVLTSIWRKIAFHVQVLASTAGTACQGSNCL